MRSALGKLGLDGLVMLLLAGCAAPSAEGAKPGSKRGATARAIPSFAEGVSVHLQKQKDGASTLSFGLPLPPGAVRDPATVRVSAAGKPLPARVDRLLATYDRDGKPSGVRAILIQLPASAMPGASLDLEIAWRGGSPQPSPARVPYRSLSMPAPEQARTATVEVSREGGRPRLKRGPEQRRTLFTGREPMVLASYPPGYLTRTDVLGRQVFVDQTRAPRWGGLRFLSEAFLPFVRSGLYLESYPLNPDPDSVVDPVKQYDVWLYDRCTTLLSAYVHAGETELLRHGLRTCSYYGSKIGLSGPTRGVFTGKPGADEKYSHARGLFAYYALTGDEAAVEAIRAMAEMMLADPLLVIHYRKGKLKAPDKLWTERLLAVAFESLLYGHLITGEVKYLTAFRDLVATAYRHITADRATLRAMTGWATLIPQDCFIHAAQQHEGDGGGEPWCSVWMTELMIDPLLRYQAQTGDKRVDELFVRLARFLRDTGSMYFKNDVANDQFWKPESCFTMADGDGVRRLVPAYGGGRRPDGSLYRTGDEYADRDHCTDATALTAAALRALKRRPELDRGKVGPFASELASFTQLHHELAFCAKLLLEKGRRGDRDPAQWKPADLREADKDPEFIKKNKIGWPLHAGATERHLSWWFNTSIMQYGLLEDAGLSFPKLTPGAIQPCK